MNRNKYLAGTAVCMVVVLIGFIIVLVQFNLMVYPARINAFSLNTGEKGVYQIEFLGEKAQLTMPDFSLLLNRCAPDHQMLTAKAYQTLERGARVWEDRLKDFNLEGEFERFLNNFETSKPLHLKK